jgi:hypothetical protein
MRGPAFEPFEFEPAYAVEVDPEFPGTGEWGCPVHGFDRDGRVVAGFESRWGAPLVTSVVAPPGRWVGMFAAGGLGGVRGAFACPSPFMLCTLVDGVAYLVDVREPGRGATIAHDQVRQVLPTADASLLLLVRFIDIVAIGREGIAWRSKRLAVDNLQVTAAGVERILCTADMLGTRPTIVVDPTSGAVIEGPVLGPL